MFAEAGARTVTRPSPSPVAGPKWTRPMLSGSGEVSASSLGLSFARAADAQSSTAAAARRLLDDRRNDLRPLGDVVRGGDVLERKDEWGIAGILVGEEVVGVDSDHPDEGALVALLMGAVRRRA